MKYIVIWLILRRKMNKEAMFVLNEESLGYKEIKKDHRFLENVVEMLKDPPQNWIFPSARYRLATTHYSSLTHPLSSTLKENTPESVSPELAALSKEFDDMREWKNTFVNFSPLKGQTFDGDHHWIMRTKFLEARLKRMDRIVEDPFEEAMSDHKKMVACEDENTEKPNKDSGKNTDEKIKDNKEIVEVTSFEKNKLGYNASEIKEENYSHSEVEVLSERLNNIEIKNEGVVDEKLHRESLKEKLNIESQTDSETVESLSGASLGHNTCENKQARSLSRLQRLRRRIRALFSCLGNNQVAPADI